MIESLRVNGTVAAGYEQVRDGFLQLLLTGAEVGASLVVHVDGEVVVDLWGGYRDERTGAPYPSEARHLLLSATKGLAAGCAHVLADRSVLDLDESLVRLWPSACDDKSDLTLRMVLAHTAGLPVLDARVPLEDVLLWDPVVRALEAQRLAWPVGSMHGYHAMTWGWLVGEVVRRASGRTLGQFFHEEIAGPLGLDAWIGLPEHEQANVIALVPPPPPPPEQLAELVANWGPDTDRGRALSLSGALPIAAFGRSEVLEAEMPSANGIATARALSRFYAALIGPVRGYTSAPLVSHEQLADATREAASGRDLVLSDDSMQVSTRFSSGFMLGGPPARWGTSSAFGHPGAGGALGFADPVTGVAFGYTCRKLPSPPPDIAGDPRAAALAGLVYEAVESEGQRRFTTVGSIDKNGPQPDPS